MNKRFFKEVGRTLNLMGQLAGAYAAACILAGVACSLPGDDISNERAREILKQEQQTFYLKDKKINLDFVPLSNLPSGIEGATYSSSGEYYIVAPDRWTDKKAFLHEIAHTIVRNPSQETFTLDFKKLEEKLKNISATEIVSYILSPRELFCNLYGIAKSYKY